MTNDARIEVAVQIAHNDGMVEGPHHKQWVIDQMVRVLLGPAYDAWVANYNADPDYEDWDIGIAP